jgi:hypothetical protein
VLAGLGWLTVHGGSPVARYPPDPLDAPPRAPLPLLNPPDDGALTPPPLRPLAAEPLPVPPTWPDPALLRPLAALPAPVPPLCPLAAPPRPLAAEPLPVPPACPLAAPPRPDAAPPLPAPPAWPLVPLDPLVPPEPGGAR